MISRRSFCTLLGGTCLAALAFTAGCSGGTSGKGPASGSSGTAASSSAASSQADAGARGAGGAVAGKRISLVSTQAEDVAEDTAWVGTLQLCWNNIVREVNGGEKLQFDQGNSQQVDALNSALFDATMLSEGHYYTYTGVRSTQARSEIEQALHDKFDQESDILDMVEWLEDPAPTDLLAYAMLYRVFTFPIAFDVVNDADGVFAQGTQAAAQDVSYFGIDGQSEAELRDQVRVLFYEDEQTYGVDLRTKDGERVMAVAGVEGDSIGDIFAAAMEKADAAEPQTRSFAGIDTLKVPNLGIDEAVRYPALEGLTWTTPSGDFMVMDEVVQTLQFELDNKGGKIKSEAAVMMRATSVWQEDPRPRAFDFDRPFALFLVDGAAQANDEEKGDLPYSALKPYFGVRVDDITKFQEGAKPAGELAGSTGVAPAVSAQSVAKVE